MSRGGARPNTGGARPGAGRPKGAVDKKTWLLREKARALGITPLDVMLEYMKTCYEAGDLAGAHLAAKDAAPYLHPRLTSVDARVDQRRGCFAKRRGRSA
jgi:hypothetical protein